MIYGERIRQARELRGLTQKELATKLSITQGRVAQIEGEFRELADSLLAEIAYHTTLPISYFSQPAENQLSSGSLLFRARTSISKKAVTKSLRDAEHIFSLAVSLSRNLDVPVLIQSLSCEPREAARKVRRTLGISPSEPVQNLIRILEGAGVWVLTIPAMKGRDAFCCWAAVGNTEVPLIVISPDCPGDRLAMNVAHELGHLILHKNQLGRLSPELEKEAFVFGAEFVMPEVGIRSELRSPFTLTLAARLKPRWGVSIQALVRRAFDLNIISERQYRYLFMQLSAKGWRTVEPILLAAEKPRLLRKMAEVAYGGSPAIEEIAAEAHMLPKEVAGIFSLYEGPPQKSVTPASRVVAFPKRSSVRA